MNTTTVQQHMITHASLMTALLEHAGHLAEAIHEVSFPQCVRYVVYTFFKGNSQDSYISDIETSAMFHQQHLLGNKPMPGPRETLDTPQWIADIYASSSKQKRIQQMIYKIVKKWESWNPSEDIGKMMKRSINELL